MNPLNIIKFIASKYPERYSMHKIKKNYYLPIPYPIKNDGYEDENGMQGQWGSEKGVPETNHKIIYKIPENFLEFFFNLYHKKTNFQKNPQNFFLTKVNI